MLIGATLEKSEIAYWQNKVLNNAWMRVFPNSDGLIPVTSDERYSYAAANGMRTIFVSSKIHAKYSGSFADGLAVVKTRLEALVDTGNFDMIYYCEHHEPEGDLGDTNGFTSVDQYKNLQLQTFAMVDSITAAKRAKIRVGHVHTRQWTESNSSTKGKYNYKTWDTGQGDFFGVDMYHDSWKPGTSYVIDKSSIVPADTFLQYFKGYKYDANDTRPRCFPELGMIGFPEDTDGSVRGQWLRDIHDRVKTWGPATTGWEFLGWIWWNTGGTEGKSLIGAGTKRWFHLDRRHTSSDGSYTVMSNSKALSDWNDISESEVPDAAEPPPAGTADPNHDQYKHGFIAGVASVESQLQPKYDSGYADGLAAGTANKQAAVDASYASGYSAGQAAQAPISKQAGRQEYYDEVSAAVVAELPPVTPTP